jgi:hypothetical protein
LYSLLEKLWFPKGATDENGYLQSKDTFVIRVFRPGDSVFNMLVRKDEVKFNYYSNKYGYVPIGLSKNAIK